MANPTSLHRRLSTLLVLAFVHQFGVCACGCLEHNGWYQSALSLLGEVHSHDHSHHQHDEPDVPMAGHSHCDGCGGLVYFTVRNSQCQHSAAGVDGLAAVVAPSPVAAPPQPTVAALKLAAAGSLAPDVRALSQVMLI